MDVHGAHQRAREFEGRAAGEAVQPGAARAGPGDEQQPWGSGRQDLPQPREGFGQDGAGGGAQRGEVDEAVEAGLGRREEGRLGTEGLQGRREGGGDAPAVLDEADPQAAQGFRGGVGRRYGYEVHPEPAHRCRGSRIGGGGG